MHLSKFARHMVSGSTSKAWKIGPVVRMGITRRCLTTCQGSTHCVNIGLNKLPVAHNRCTLSLPGRDLRTFATMSVRHGSETDKTDKMAKEGGEKTDDKPLTQRQKLTRIFAAYGSTAVVFHTTISLTSLGICYTIVSSGIDMVALLEKVGIASEAGLGSTLASGASTFVIAYACHKVFMPVRIFLTVTCTPVIIKKLRSMGILKEKVAGK